MNYSYWKDDKIKINNELCTINNKTRKLLVYVDVILILVLSILFVAVFSAYIFKVSWLQWLT